jgi:hypothetical protein
MDKVYLRSLFLREKGFLKKLYLGEEGTSVLILANDKSLDVLIRVLHLLASGEIPMRKQDEIVLRNAKKLVKINDDFISQLCCEHIKRL